MAYSSHRTLDVTLISAQDLKDVNLFSHLEVYAAIALSCDPSSRQRTQTDRAGAQNPTWNSTLRFSVPSDAAERGVNLVITLHAERALGDRLVGEVRIPIKELLTDSSSTSAVRKVSYQVRRPSGNAKGVLTLSYSFSGTNASETEYPPQAKLDTTTAAAYPPQTKLDSAAETAYPPKTKLDAPAEEPVTAYPVYPPHPSTAPVYPPPSASTGSASAYHAPPVGYPKNQQPPPANGSYGYGAAPPAAGGCGADPAPAYGGNAPQAVKPPKKNKFGMGLGAGLLGGLLIGDALGDAAAYDAGYDAGFGGGFDFGFY